MRQGGRGEEPHEGNARSPLPLSIYSDNILFASVQSHFTVSKFVLRPKIGGKMSHPTRDIREN